MVFNLGSPSSLSVYTFFFLLRGPMTGLDFCCFGGGSFRPFEGFDFLTPRAVAEDLAELLPLSDLLGACFERTVLVGAIEFKDNT